MQKKCLGTLFCASSCGYIVSPGFPRHYLPNQRCVWHITVQTGAHVELEFLSFDIIEEFSVKCQGDSVTVRDTNKRGIALYVIGQYCNTNLPPKLLRSAWNHIMVEFFSDDEHENEGFHLKYQDAYYTIPDGYRWENNHPGK